MFEFCEDDDIVDTGCRATGVRKIWPRAFVSRFSSFSFFVVGYSYIAYRDIVPENIMVLEDEETFRVLAVNLIDWQVVEKPSTPEEVPSVVSIFVLFMVSALKVGIDLKPHE